MRVTVSEVAQHEVAGIARWHQNQPTALGYEFLDAFEQAVVEIGESPYLHAVADDSRVGHEDREYFVRRFKQRIIYYITGDEVRVIAVVHSARKPGVWHIQADHDERR